MLRVCGFVDLIGVSGKLLKKRIKRTLKGGPNSGTQSF